MHTHTYTYKLGQDQLLHVQLTRSEKAPQAKRKRKVIEALLPPGYSFGTPQAEQYAPQVPPPPATPGAAPLGYAPATTPTQDLSKASAGQPDFPYSQYGKNSIVCYEVCCPLLSHSLFSTSLGPAHLSGYLIKCHYTS